MKKTLLVLFSAMVSVVATAQNMQGTMETWANYNAGLFPPIALEKPAGWRGADSLICTLGPLLTGGSGTFTKQLYKTTDKHSGTYATMIMTKTEDTLGSTPGILTNASVGFDISTFTPSMTGGVPVTTRIGYVSAWVKYLPKGGDSAGVTVLAVITGAGSGGTDSIVGAGYLGIGTTSTYQSVSVPIIYTDTTSAGPIPNAIQVIFSSSDGSSTTDSSMLFVDDVTAGNFPAGITIPLMTDEEIKCYPNPTTGVINLSSSLNEELVWVAYNTNGQKIADKKFITKAAIDMSNLPQGMYFYNVVNTEGEIVQKGKFNISK